MIKMAVNSSIEWTQSTWNPVTGCTKISAGCKHCYAERMANRLQKIGHPNYVNGFQVTLLLGRMDFPLCWRMLRLVFVNSMSDLFSSRCPRRIHSICALRKKPIAIWKDPSLRGKEASRGSSPVDERGRAPPRCLKESLGKARIRELIFVKRIKK